MSYFPICVYLCFMIFLDHSSHRDLLHVIFPATCEKTLVLTKSIELWSGLFLLKEPHRDPHLLWNEVKMCQLGAHGWSPLLFAPVPPCPQTRGFCLPLPLHSQLHLAPSPLWGLSCVSISSLETLPSHPEEFPGSPVTGTLHFHCWGPQVGPWLGN